MYWQQRYQFIFVLLLYISILNSGFAQDSSKELWPELDVWYKLTPSWRASVLIPISRNIETNYREGSFVCQMDYSWGKPKRIIFMRMLNEEEAERIKNKMIRGGYLTGVSLDDKGQTYSENTAFTEFHYRIPVKGSFLITHRLRADLRWMGNENEFSQRYRYRFMIEKELKAKKVSFVPYINAETFYDSRFNTINRFRGIAGTSVSWSNRFAIESNFTYQYDSKSSVTNLYATNLILHIYFQTKAASK